ncbi:MAG: cyclase family protein [Gammaproteobacteria bacterium]|nr:cyclase family protein [Gammaproteobacteria bacterium]
MAVQFKEIIDLGHEYFNGMLNIGGTLVAFWPLETPEHLRKITQGKLAMEGRMIMMPEHCGTHLDVPKHFVEGGTPVNEVPLEQLILPGHLLDFSHKKNGEAITISDFEEAEAKSGQKIGPGKATMCWTGVDDDWGKPGFTMNRPYVPTDVAQWLVDKKITIFCTDLIGMDDPSEWWWPTHEIWLRNGICMVQQLCNLDKLKDKEFLFVCLPLKMRDGTASPVRPVALVT